MGSDQPSGVLLVDKPSGMTSHDVVESLRRLPTLKGSKVGHTGTLDPFATGLLLAVFGSARKYQNELTGLPKVYEVKARFGARSSTGDPEGEIEQLGSRLGPTQIEAAFEGFLGDILQRVPMTSAVKVNGERLYKKAHRGEVIETPIKRVHIESIEMKRFDESSQSAELLVKCGSGAYVRQLVEDIGVAAGSVSYCESLRRTAIGDFSIGDAATIEELSSQSSIETINAWKPLTVSAGNVRIL